MLPTPTAEDLRAAVQCLVAQFAPLRILVFGSYARGEARPGSDLDLLVVLPHVEDKRATTIAMSRALAALHLPIPSDIVVTTPADIDRRGWVKGPVLYDALQEGVSVYENLAAQVVAAVHADLEPHLRRA
jgi:predicted nucleotidyltransferase